MGGKKTLRFRKTTKRKSPASLKKTFRSKRRGSKRRGSKTFRLKRRGSKRRGSIKEGGGGWPWGSSAEERKQKHKEKFREMFPQNYNPEDGDYDPKYSTQQREYKPDYRTVLSGL